METVRITSRVGLLDLVRVSGTKRTGERERTTYTRVDRVSVPTIPGIGKRLATGPD